jgi:V8-like Glu-specific endopeptidase
MYRQDMHKATSILFLLILPLMVNTQSGISIKNLLDVNIKSLLDKKSIVTGPRSWEDWNCKSRKNGDQKHFDLFCKFLEFPNDNTQDNNNKNILPDLLDCVDDGVRYKEKGKKHLLDRITGIASAELCRKKCSNTNGCKYWTWMPKRNKKICKLMKKVKNTGFRRQENKAVSGTMLKGCNPKKPDRRTSSKGKTCVDPRGLQGQCNFIYESQCGEVLNAVKQLGVTPQVRRFLLLAIRSPCGFHPGQGDYTLCCVPRTPPPPPPTACGIADNTRASMGESTRVVGGELAALNAWPWAVALGVPASGNKLTLKCGGTLISKDYVLTAAHCFEQSITTVRLSDLDITTTRDNADHEDVKIERKIMHPLYDRKTMKNDIALIKLARSVTFRRGLRPACLPKRYKGYNLKNLNITPKVIGWGQTENYQPVSSHLLQADVSIVDNPTCSKKYASFIGITSNQICAGDDERDSCGGDSGGALLSSERDNGKWSVIGVVSFGARGFCANSRFPGVYTRVDKYLDWIASNTK